MRGRAFREGDRTGAPVAIVNEAFVRTFWKGIDPIGRRVRPRFGDTTPWVTVIGVTKDVKQAGVDRATGTELYFLLDQLPQVFPTMPALNSILRSITENGGMHIVLRSAVPAATLQPSIANACVRPIPSLPDDPVCSNMEDVFRGSVRRPRMLMQLLAGFAGPPLLLAAIGITAALCRTWSRRSGARSGFGWRSALKA